VNGRPEQGQKVRVSRASSMTFLIRFSISHNSFNSDTHRSHHDRQRSASLSSHASSSETLHEHAANRGPRRMPSDRSIGSSASNSYQYTQTNQAGSYTDGNTRSKQQRHHRNGDAAYRKPDSDAASMAKPRAPSPPRAWSFVVCVPLILVAYSLALVLLTVCLRCHLVQSSIRDASLVGVWDGRTPRGKNKAKPRPQDSYSREDFSKINIGMGKLRRAEESLARVSRELVNKKKPSNVDCNGAVDAACRLLAEWLPQAILMPDLQNRRKHLDADALATLEVDLRAASTLSERLSGTLEIIFANERRPHRPCPAKVLTPFLCALECFRLLTKYCHSLLIRQDWDQQDLRDTAEEAQKLVVQVRACGLDFEGFERTYETCTTVCNFVSKSYAGRTPFHARLRHLNWEPAPQA
jgi:hypothetical protein